MHNVPKVHFLSRKINLNKKNWVTYFRQIRVGWILHSQLVISNLYFFWQKWTFSSSVISTYICNFVPSVSLSLIHVDFRCSFSTLHMISAPHCVIFGLWRKNSSWPHRNVFDQLHRLKRGDLFTSSFSICLKNHTPNNPNIYSNHQATISFFTEA